MNLSSIIFRVNFSILIIIKDDVAINVIITIIAKEVNDVIIMSAFNFLMIEAFIASS